MKNIKKVLFSTISQLVYLFLLIGAILIGVFLFISRRYDLMGWTNAVSFTAVLYLGLLWLSFANSKGVFDILTYGLKTFINGFRKDYKKMDFYEYTTSKESPSKSYYISLSIATGLFAVATIVLLIIVL